MFERFTDRARRVTTASSTEARLLNHNYIGTEHLLLGLLAEGPDGVAAKTLTALNVNLDQLRDRVKELVGVGSASPSGHIPFTPRAKKVLELSLREALQLGHNYIGTEHMLLALLREGEGVGAQVLGLAGLELDAVRKEVVQQLKTPEAFPDEVMVREAHEQTVASAKAEYNTLLAKHRAQGVMIRSALKLLENGDVDVAKEILRSVVEDFAI